jgi:hypothetical protein
VGSNDGFNGVLEFFFVQTAIEHEKIGKVIANLALMCDALGVDAILYFG